MSSQFIPELPGLPKLPIITDAGTAGLRLQGTAAKALPPMGECWLYDQRTSNGS